MTAQMANVYVVLRVHWYGVHLRPHGWSTHRIRIGSTGKRDL